MSLVIDATIGGVGSNSYVTLTEANTYFDGRMYSEAWTSLTDDIKRNQALVMATKRINTEKFYGTRESNTQALPFPRLSLGYLDGIFLDSTIPTILKEAQYELALHILSVDMSQQGSNVDTIEKIKLGTLDIKYALDSSDNINKSFNTMPESVTSLIGDLVSNGSSSAFFDIGR
jgi:hypothetical protein